VGALFRDPVFVLLLLFFSLSAASLAFFILTLSQAAILWAMVIFLALLSRIALAS
jgi:hypothetical protein